MTTQLARLDVRDGGRVTVARIEGEIDMSNAADLGRAIAGRVTNHAKGLVIDLTEVTYLDSAAIHVVYELREQLAARNIALRLVVPPGAPTMTTLELTGVPAAVPVLASAAEAEASVD